MSSSDHPEKSVPERPLMVAISSSALFDRREEQEIWEKKGLLQYVAHEINNEDKAYPRGTAFPLIEALLRLNAQLQRQVVEVVIVSRTEPETGIRIMNSVDLYRLEIAKAAFVGGTRVGRYLRPYDVSLFLSKDKDDVRDALRRGIAAGQLYDPPRDVEVDPAQLRIAFDGDSVVFSNESEIIYQQKGLEAFLNHEKVNALKPLPPGPFAPFLKWLSVTQNDLMVRHAGGTPVIRTVLVTSRNSCG
jgi:5'-nucleotidase